MASAWASHGNPSSTVLKHVETPTPQEWVSGVSFSGQKLAPASLAFILPLLFLHFITLSSTSFSYRPGGLPVAEKWPTYFLSFSVSEIHPFLSLPSLGLASHSAIGSLPHSFSWSDHHLLSHLSNQDSTWSDQFLYLQIIFCAWLIHCLDGVSTHVRKICLLLDKALHPRKLSSS
jgi:hypothetical protein